jgi:hypothetical protein
VKYKLYKDIWKAETKTNPHLFETHILETFADRKDALTRELELQIGCDVVKSPVYVNQSLACVNGYFGRTLKGKESHNYGKKATEETKRKLSESHIGQKPSEKQREAVRNRIIPPELRQKLSVIHKGNKYALGYKLTPEQKRKQSESLKGKNLGRKLTDEQKQAAAKGAALSGKGKITINNGTIEKRIFAEQLVNYPEFVRGRLEKNKQGLKLGPIVRYNLEIGEV